MPNPQPPGVNVTEDHVNEPIGATTCDEMGDDWVCHYCFTSNPGTSLNCLHCDEDPCVDVQSRTSGTFHNPKDDVSCGAYGHRQQSLSTRGAVGDPHMQHLAASVSIVFVDDVMHVAQEALFPLHHSRIFIEKQLTGEVSIGTDARP